MSAVDPLLSIRDLHVDFHNGETVTPAVRGVSFDVPAGGTVAAGGLSTWIPALVPVAVAFAAPSVGVPLVVLAIGIVVAVTVGTGVARLHRLAEATEGAHQHQVA